jgi:hypothetical protein
VTAAPTPPPALADAELDRVYTHLCRTMTALGEAHAPLFLARFALLAVARLGDADAALALVDAAADPAAFADPAPPPAERA